MSVDEAVQSIARAVDALPEFDGYRVAGSVINADRVEFEIGCPQTTSEEYQVRWDVLFQLERRALAIGFLVAELSVRDDDLVVIARFERATPEELQRDVGAELLLLHGPPPPVGE